MRASLFALVAAATVLAACGGRESDTGKPTMTKNDKFLTCDEILLEINDAKFLNAQAQENKGVGFKDIIWPVGYAGSYRNAEEAIEATNKRISYLSNIYAIKRCDDPYADSKR